jgi:hypothetical protein
MKTFSNENCPGSSVFPLDGLDILCFGSEKALEAKVHSKTA